MKAYFTVEAACVLPIILWVYVFLIYSMFYQYDRCLLEQDTALSVLKEQEVMATDLSGKDAKVWDPEQYPAFDLGENGMVKDKGEICVWADGVVRMPLKGIVKWTGEDDFRVEASFASMDIKPAEWVRMIQKIMEEFGK